MDEWESEFEMFDGIPIGKLLIDKKVFPTQLSERFARQFDRLLEFKNLKRIRDLQREKNNVENNFIS